MNIKDFRFEKKMGFEIKLLWFFCEYVYFTFRFYVLDIKGKKGKSEHLYSACIVQTTLKRSGMDHTAFNLQRTPYLSLPRKRSPDGVSTEYVFCDFLF